MSETGEGGAIKPGEPSVQCLNVTIHEAWGITDERKPMWDEQFTEGYVKVELRGKCKTLKYATCTQKVDHYSLRWDQEIRLELTDKHEELRIMLCKEMSGDTHNRSTGVVAACGIFINQILRAVPINKAFELFKPGKGEGVAGGFIRVTLKTGNSAPRITTIVEDEPQQLDASPPRDEDEEPPNPTGGGGGKTMRIVRNILFVAGIATAAAVVFRVKTRKEKC